MRTGTGTVAPLSFQQQDIVDKIKRSPRYASRYDRSFLFQANGDLDLARLTAAIGDVVERHATLRTTVEQSAGRYVQRVHPVASVRVEATNHPDGSVDAIVQELLDSRLSADEILGGAPLFYPRIHLVGTERLLSFTLNHLLYDGWSVIVLWRDLAECYAARAEGRPPNLPVLSASYADFARQQRECWSEVRNDALAYYQNLTKSCTGEISWPVHDTGVDASSWQTGGLELSLPADAVSSIRDVSRAVRVSPFMVLLAATCFGVARVSGQDDLLIGTDMAGRDELAWQNAVGHFVNTRIIRVGVDRERPLLDLVSAIRESWMIGDEYNHVHAEEILKEIGAPAPLTINMPSLSPEWEDSYRKLRLTDITLTPIPVEPAIESWRDFYVFWLHEGIGYRALVGHRLARMATATAAAVADEIVEILRNPSRSGQAGLPSERRALQCG